MCRFLNIDGPFGPPSSNIYRAEHAVLIGTGIGITPFASILQSIIHRYLEIKRTCPNCNYSWTSEINTSMFNLRKVDFIWINREHKSFEWFVSLLSQLEAEQREQGGEPWPEAHDLPPRGLPGRSIGGCSICTDCRWAAPSLVSPWVVWRGPEGAVGARASRSDRSWRWGFC